MTMNPTEPQKRWDTRRVAKAERLRDGAPHSDGKVVKAGRLKDLLHSVIRPGDRVALEGDNQKQADYLSRTLADCDPKRIHGLHMLISSVSRSEHLDLFDRGIATKLDLAYAGPQSVRIAQMVEDGTVQIGAIHTYVELYARMFVDLCPDVVLLCADKADRDGNLYTGANTEDTPTIAEAGAFHDGVVIVQADEIVDFEELPRVDIPGSWVDYVVAADRPFFLEPLFTRDPRLHRRRRDPQGHDRHPGRLRTPPGGLAESRRRVRHGRDRTAAAHLWRTTRSQGPDREALGAQPAPHADPRDRVGVGRVDLQLRRGVRHEPLCRRPPRRVLQRRRRLAALESGARSTGRPVRHRHVHRIVAADRRGRQLLDRHRRAAVRVRRRPEHGSRSPRPPALHRRRGWTSPTATVPADAAARSWCRWPKPSGPEAFPRSWRHSTRSRSASRRACRCRR